MNEAIAGYLAAAVIAIVCVGLAALFLVRQYDTLVEPEAQVRIVSQKAPCYGALALLSALVSASVQPQGLCSLNAESASLP